MKILLENTIAADTKLPDPVLILMAATRLRANDDNCNNDANGGKDNRRTVNFVN